MMRLTTFEAGLILGLLSGSVVIACTPREDGTDDTAPAPVPIDTASPTGTGIDTATTPDTAVATPPITPSPSTVADTPPSGAQPPGGQRPAGQTAGQQGQVSQAEYEGWRQYSVNCARCHGQDVLPNPVAANLLISAGPGGPVSSRERFVQVVSEGRPDRGMPAFKSIMSADQIQAVYAYVKGRADKRIPPGRPAQPAG